jgi:hypothetical protein
MRLLTTVIPLDTNTNSFKNNFSYLVRSSFVLYDRQYLNEKQSEFLFLLFEVHITLGFKSEVSAFIFTKALFCSALIFTIANLADYSYNDVKLT